MITKVDGLLLNRVVSEANITGRKRKNFNFHATFDDPINRMLNAIEPGSYMQPHKHENPDKREVFVLLKGKFVVVFFNDEGIVFDYFILDHKTGNYGAEIPPGIWHTIISLEKGSVVYEIKDGPYVPVDDKNFALWAPKEGAPGCNEFLESILMKVGV